MMKMKMNKKQTDISWEFIITQWTRMWDTLMSYANSPDDEQLATEIMHLGYQRHGLEVVAMIAALFSHVTPNSLLRLIKAVQGYGIWPDMFKDLRSSKHTNLYLANLCNLASAAYPDDPPRIACLNGLLSLIHPSERDGFLPRLDKDVASLLMVPIQTRWRIFVDMKWGGQDSEPFPKHAFDEVSTEHMRHRILKGKKGNPKITDLHVWSQAASGVSAKTLADRLDGIHPKVHTRLNVCVMESGTPELVAAGNHGPWGSSSSVLLKLFLDDSALEEVVRKVENIAQAESSASKTLDPSIGILVPARPAVDLYIPGEWLIQTIDD
jgi:hypothetical protein